MPSSALPLPTRDCAQMVAEYGPTEPNIPCSLAAKTVFGKNHWSSVKKQGQTKTLLSKKVYMYMQFQVKLGQTLVWSCFVVSLSCGGWKKKLRTTKTLRTLECPACKRLKVPHYCFIFGHLTRQRGTCVSTFAVKPDSTETANPLEIRLKWVKTSNLSHMQLHNKEYSVRTEQTVLFNFGPESLTMMSPTWTKSDRRHKTL